MGQNCPAPPRPVGTGDSGSARGVQQRGAAGPGDKDTRGAWHGGAGTAVPAPLLQPRQARWFVPQNLARPRLPSPSPHAPVRSSAFVPGPAGGARGEALQSKVGLIYCSLAPALDFEAARLLLTASINHPGAVPLWARARRVSFAVAARQEDFPGSGKICFTFVACFWHLLLNQNPLDVVISKRFTAAACEVGGIGGQSTEI